LQPYPSLHGDFTLREGRASIVRLWPV